MTVVPPAAEDRVDPYREHHGLEEAKRKLEEIKGRPFDIDKTLAAHRAREEQNRDRGRRIAQTLEETVEKARQKRHDVLARAEEVETLTRATRGLRSIKEHVLPESQKKITEEKNERGG